MIVETMTLVPSTNSYKSRFRMNSNNSNTSANSASSSSQRSATAEVTERMQAVDLNTPEVLTRDQRRLLDHLRNKFNIAEEVALARAKGYKRKNRNASPQPGSSKKTRSEPHKPAEAKAPMDRRRAEATSSATSSTMHKGKTGKAERARKEPNRKANNTTHGKARTGKAAPAPPAPKPYHGKPQGRTNKADCALYTQIGRQRISLDTGRKPPGDLPHKTTRTAVRDQQSRWPKR